MLPMMDPPDVAALEEAFLRRRARAVDVLEWGSGGRLVPPDPLRRAGDFLNSFYYRYLYKAHKA